VGELYGFLTPHVWIGSLGLTDE